MLTLSNTGERKKPYSMSVLKKSLYIVTLLICRNKLLK